MIVPGHVRKLISTRHRVLRYNKSMTIIKFTACINEGNDRLIAPNIRLSKAEGKELAKILEVSKVNTLEICEPISFENGLLVFLKVQSHSLKINFSLLISLKKYIYKQLKKRMVKSPVLTFDVNSFEIQTSKENQRLRNLALYLKK